MKDLSGAAKRKIWTVSNAISAFRALLSIPMAFAITSGDNLMAILLGVLALLSDGLDGALARKNDSVTEFGKLIDPLADKILMATAAIALLIDGRMPVWFASIVFARDLILLFGGLWVSKKIGYVLPSNVLGKITAFVAALAVGVMILDIKEAIDWAAGVASFFLIVSFLHYCVRAVRAVKNLGK